MEEDKSARLCIQNLNHKLSPSSMRQVCMFVCWYDCTEHSDSRYQEKSRRDKLTTDFNTPYDVGKKLCCNRQKRTRRKIVFS